MNNERTIARRIDCSTSLLDRFYPETACFEPAPFWLVLVLSVLSHASRASPSHPGTGAPTTKFRDHARGGKKGRYVVSEEHLTAGVNQERGFTGRPVAGRMGYTWQTPKMNRMSPRVPAALDARPHLRSA